MNEILLVDAQNLAIRSHFAHATLKTREGQMSGLVFGFLRDVLRLHRKCPDAPMIFCWDGGGKTWRHRAYQDYKGQRKIMPWREEVKSQLDDLIPLLDSLGFHNPRLKGVEADDIIGILSKRLTKKWFVRIFSSDRDMYQLLGPKVTVWTRKKIGQVWTEYFVSEVEAAAWLGAPFRALLEIKAMAGDPSDNLKGLPRVGFKTAVKLWKEGLRVGEVSNGKLWKRYDCAKHWPRIQEEYRLAHIVRDTTASVWTKEQSAELKKMVAGIVLHPHRPEKYSDDMRDALYNVLGRYELEEIFKKRQMFWQIK